MKKLVSEPLLGKTGENARRIASAMVLEKATLGLTKVLGPEHSRNLTPKSFKDGRLSLTAAHGVWAQEVVLRQQELIQAINAEIGRPEVKSVVLK